jgi:hypothetical protein
MRFHSLAGQYMSSSHRYNEAPGFGSGLGRANSPQTTGRRCNGLSTKSTRGSDSEQRGSLGRYRLNRVDDAGDEKSRPVDR